MAVGREARRYKLRRSTPQGLWCHVSLVSWWTIQKQIKTLYSRARTFKVEHWRTSCKNIGGSQRPNINENSQDGKHHIAVTSKCFGRNKDSHIVTCIFFGNEQRPTTDVDAWQFIHKRMRIIPEYFCDLKTQNKNNFILGGLLVVDHVSESYQSIKQH